MTAFIGRREFITLLGGAAAMWPVAVRAQQPDRVRRIGGLFGRPQDDPRSRSISAHYARPQERGWTHGAQRADGFRWSAAGARPGAG